MAWKVHRDAWNGYSVNVPSGWRTKTGAENMILVGDGGGQAIMVWPLQAPAGSTPEQLASRVAQTLADQDRTFQIWINQNSPQEAALVFSREAGRLRGVLRLQLLPEGRGALATGYQAPCQQLEDRRRSLEHVLSSFQPIESLPRELFVDPSERAFSLEIPQGWRVEGGVDRWRTPNGEGALVWMVEDPDSRARVAQESLVIDMGGPLGGQAFASGVPVAPAPPGLQFAGLPIYVFMGQYHWKSRPFMKVEDYCRNVLVPMAQPLRSDLKLEGVLHDPALDEMAHLALRPVELQMGVSIQLETGVALMTYGEQGILYRECSILVNWTMPHRPDPLAMMMGGVAPQYWFCSMGPTLRAPVAVWDEKAPILEGISRSFQANQAWEGRELVGASQPMSQQRVQAEAKRARLLKETMDYCQHVRPDLQRRREIAQAEIAGREDVDTLGPRQILDSGWDNCWLNSGEIGGSRPGDLDTHLEANGWNRLRVF